MKSIFLLFLSLLLIHCTENKRADLVHAKNDENFRIDEKSKSKIQNLFKSIQKYNLSPKNLKYNDLKLHPKSGFPKSFSQIAKSERPRKFEKSLTQQNCQSIAPPRPSDPRLLKDDFYTKQTAEVSEIASELSNVEAIFDFVQNKISNSRIFGATQSATKLLYSRKGSSIDKANLLMALLRARSVPAYFEFGTVKLSNSSLKALFNVSSFRSIFNILAINTGDYYNSGEGSYFPLYQREDDGSLTWNVPHIWVQAYINGEWVSLDTSLILFKSIDADKFLQPLGNKIALTDWIFRADSDEHYIKPYDYFTGLIKQFSPSESTEFSNISTSNSTSASFGQIIGLSAPCKNEFLFSIENSNYEYRAKISLLDKTTESELKSFESATAKQNESTTYLRHSAGLLSEVSTGQSGNIEFFSKGEIKATYSATTGSEYRMKIDFIPPSKYRSSLIMSRTFASNYVAGEIYYPRAINTEVTSLDLEKQIERVLEVADESTDSREKMAELHNLAGKLFLFKASKGNREVERFRGLSNIPWDVFSTYTQTGAIVEIDGEKELGLVPLRGGIDATFGGNYLSSVEEFSDSQGIRYEQGLLEVLITLSRAEATMWEDIFGVRGYSAERLLQLAADQKNEDPVTYDYTFLEGEVFNGTGSSHIASALVDGNWCQSGSETALINEYDNEGTEIWTTNKNIVDSENTEACGYFITEKNGLFGAFFSIVNYGTQSLLDSLELNGKDNSSQRGTSDVFEQIWGNLNKNIDQLLGDKGGAGGQNNIPAQPELEGETIHAGPQTYLAQSQSQSCFPVNYSSGYMWHSFTDFHLNGKTRTNPLNFIRTYHSRQSYNTTSSWVGRGDFGPGWIHNWDSRILDGSRTNNTLDMGPIVATNTNLLWISPEGSQILFTHSSGYFSSPEGVTANLVVNGNTFEITTTGNMKYIYKNDLSSNHNGRLLKKIDSFGDEVVLSYDGSGRLLSISSSYAGDLIITRDINNRISKIRNPRNNLITKYKYESARLATSFDLDGFSTNYDYNSSQVGTNAENLLVKITDPLERKIEFEYYRNGKVFKEKSPGGGVQVYTYSPYLYNKYTRVTSPNGYITEYHFDDQFRIIRRIYPDGGVVFNEWNSDDRIISTIDQHGHKTQFTYDSRGNQTGIKKPTDSIYRQVTYNQTFDIPNLIDPIVGASTTFSIDSQTGNVLSQSRSNGQQTLSKVYTYDSFGNRISETSNIGQFSHLRDPEGLLTYKFDVNNPEEISYDKKRRIRLRKFGSGRVLSYSYDNFDRITKIDDSHGPDTRNYYDAVGNLIRRDRLADGQTDTATFEYDHRDRMIAETNYLGERTEYKYDIVGVGCTIRDKPTQIISPEGKITQYEYDYAGRKTKVTYPDGDSISFAYTLRGDLKSVVDPGGLVTNYEYDESRRLKKIIRQSAANYHTNLRGFEVSYGAEEILFNYDESDRLTSKEQLLSSEKNVNGRYVTQFTYDDFDRVIKKEILHKRGDNIVTTFDTIEYKYSDLIGQDLVNEVKNKNVILNFNYQSQPPYRLLEYSRVPTNVGANAGISGESFRIDPAVESAYGRIKRDGATVLNFNFDPAGRRTLVSATHQGTTNSVNYSYDSLGRQTSQSFSNGLNGAWTYDKLNRIKTIAWTGTESFTQSLSYSPDGLITQNQREIGTYDYEYNLKNELTKADFTGSLSLQKNYYEPIISYSPGGNIDKYNWESGSEYSVKTFNNFLTDFYNSDAVAPDSNGLGHTRELEHYYLDEMVIDYYPNGQIYKMNSDFSGNNPFYKLKAEYLYDGLGRRIAKILNVNDDGIPPYDYTVIYSHLGMENRILYAKSWKSTDSTEKESMYVDNVGIDSHLFRIKDDGSVVEYSIDYLGSVLNSERIGTHSIYAPYGYNADLGIDTSLFHPVTYGFAGKEYDSETDLYYSRARYFSHRLGRFVTKDPLGIDGGHTNLYLYCGNNPISCLDPMGEQSCPIINDSRMNFEFQTLNYDSFPRANNMTVHPIEQGGTLLQGTFLQIDRWESGGPDSIRAPMNLPENAFGVVHTTPNMDINSPEVLAIGGMSFADMAYGDRTGVPVYNIAPNGDVYRHDPNPDYRGSGVPFMIGNIYD